VLLEISLQTLFTFDLQSQIKKLMYAAFRIRKLQEAQDPSLLVKRPAKSTYVWEAFKDRLDEALDRERECVIFPPLSISTGFKP
jgi:hypothetical protein